MLVRGHNHCKTISESPDNLSFGTVTTVSRDPKGKKKKEQISNSAQFKISELNEKCKDCMKNLALCGLEQTGSFDHKNQFEACRKKERERHDEHFCHGHFKYKPTL